MKRRITVLLTLICLAALPVAAQDLDALTQPVTDYIAANPDSISVICGVADADPTVTHNPDERSPIASTFKIFTLLELARQADAGQLDLTEAVPLNAVNAYWLPGTDGGAQEQWMATFGDQPETVTLTDIADGMIRFSSNANADFLLAILGDEGFETLYDDLGISNTDVPISILGLFLLGNNHETGVADFEALDAETAASESARLATLYLEDQEWVAQQLDYMETYNTALADPAAFDEEIALQAAFFDLFGPMSTAADLYATLTVIYGDEYLSDDARAFVRNLLDWPMDQPGNTQVFESLATKGGSLSGILSSAWYGQPLDGEARQLVVIYRDIPVETWLEWLETFVFQIFEARALGLVGEDCGVFTQVLEG